MSDINLDADPSGSVELNEHTHDATVGVDGGEDLTRRARVQRSLDQAQLSASNAAARARVAASQRGLSQARAAAWDATGRARSAAAPRRTAIPTERTPATAGPDTLVDLVRAYRPQLLTAAAAVVGVLMVVLRRRAAPRRVDAVIDVPGDAVIDAIEVNVSDVPLNGEPLDN